MWRRSFVAATVALGGTVDDALAAIDAAPGGGRPDGPAPDGPLEDLVSGLRAPHRAARAASLATAVRGIVLAIDEATLR